MMLMAWRLIHSAAQPGAFNMALDEAILEAASRGDSPPTLRLYAWSPACLSLGYAQPFADVDTGALKKMGWDLTRRPTGGRAILHTDELTYAVIAPAIDPVVSGSLLESYRRISRALLAGLAELSLEAHADQQYDLPTGARQNGPVCFEVPSSYEITVEGRKLVGSAQARRKDGVLQHGSLPLYGNLARITRALVFEDDKARKKAIRRLLAHATTLERVLGKPGEWEQCATALENGFRKELGLNFERGEPTKAEMERAEELVKEKYANLSWVARI